MKGGREEGKGEDVASESSKIGISVFFFLLFLFYNFQIFITEIRAKKKKIRWTRTKMGKCHTMNSSSLWTRHSFRIQQTRRILHWWWRWDFFFINSVKKKKNEKISKKKKIGSWLFFFCRASNDLCILKKKRSSRTIFIVTRKTSLLRSCLASSIIPKWTQNT